MRKIFKNELYYSLTKRIFDVIASGLSIIVLFPIFLIIYVILRIQESDSVIFKQERIGKDGRIFNILKFRTMLLDTPSIAAKDINETEYVTKVGKFLRRTSLDELPQLINILKGEMSFVGPRPLIPNEGDINLLRVENGVNTLIPGLTGWAQVKARNTNSTEEKLELDLYYYKNHSFLFDMKIIILTFSSLIH